MGLKWPKSGYRNVGKLNNPLTKIRLLCSVVYRRGTEQHLFNSRLGKKSGGDSVILLVRESLSICGDCKSMDGGQLHNNN